MFEITYKKDGVKYMARIPDCANRLSAEAKFITTRRMGRGAILEIKKVS